MTVNSRIRHTTELQAMDGDVDSNITAIEYLILSTVKICATVAALFFCDSVANFKYLWHKLILQSSEIRLLVCVLSQVLIFVTCNMTLCYFLLTNDGFLSLFNADVVHRPHFGVFNPFHEFVDVFLGLNSSMHCIVSFLG